MVLDKTSKNIYSGNQLKDKTKNHFAENKLSAFIQMSLQNKYFGVYLHSQKGTKRGRAEKKRGGGRERERGRSEKGKEDDRLQ